MEQHNGYLCLWLLALVTVCYSASDMFDDDPCLQGNHVILNEVNRSTGYITKPGDTPLCDIHLNTTWYRFRNGLGDKMPTSCPGRLRCGTVVPVWINGTHPLETEGVVQRQACANFEDQSGPSCCQRSSQMLVKNCGAFFVYYLMPTPSCPIAYCAGDKAPCPPDTWSLRGFEPCYPMFPTLSGDPVLSGPHIVQNKSFSMKCLVQAPNQHPSQRFEVQWTFDDKTDPAIGPTIYSDSYKEIFLDGKRLKNHLNQRIACKVRSYFDGQGSQKSSFRKSNEYFAGIQINPSLLRISEADPVKKIRITSTVPILCDNRADCCLMMKLGISKAHELMAQQSCEYRMCSHHWDDRKKKAEISIPFLATRDLVRERSTRTLLDFDQLLPAGGGDYINIFEGFTPAPVPITVDDSRTFNCFIWGDPHIRQVDGRYSQTRQVDFYNLGTYTAYEAKHREFQVQLRTWKCTPSLRVTCVCGVTVREYNDVIKIDQCDQNRWGHVSAVVSVANQLSPGTKIERSRDGKHIQVMLPSGSVVKILARRSNMAVKIVTPGTDLGSATGICGTTDGVSTNDLTRPNGVVDLPCSQHASSCQPKPFINSWRTKSRSNLFENVPPVISLPPEDESSFCACAKNRAATKPMGDCSYRKHISKGLDMCKNCHDITRRVRPSTWGSSKRSAPLFEDVDMPDVPYVDMDLPDKDLNLTWPNAQGMTRAEANDTCRTALKANPLWRNCRRVSNMAAEVIASCMEDILLSGSLEFVKSAFDVFTDICQAHVAENPDNYVIGPDGEKTLKPKYSTELCSSLDCSGHGHCSPSTGGVCVCNIGWAGENCHIQAGKGIQLDKIRSGPLCDLSQRPCRKIFFDVSNLDLSDHLSCGVALTNAQGNKTANIMLTQGEYLSASRIACEIPSSGDPQTIGWSPPAASSHYKISAAFDGFHFGNQLALHVFDGACLDCDGAGCSIKPNTCQIDNICYMDGAVSLHDEAQVCDPAQSTTSWSVRSAPSPTTPPQKQWWVSLSGPDANLLLHCDLHDLGNRVLGSDVTVQWLMNGQLIQEQRLDQGATGVETHVYNLQGSGGGGKFTCSVTLDGRTLESGTIEIV